jgi:hypothetical protein
MCMLPETEAPKVPTLEGVELNLRTLRQQCDELMAAIDRALGHLDVGDAAMAKTTLRCARDKVLGD